MLDKNHSSSAINIHNINIFSNPNKSNIITDNINTYIYKNNDINLTKENNFSNISVKNNNQLNKHKKLKLPLNITNNSNINKNDMMININTNLITDNLNIEKLKVQQKLVEYRKLIDKKIYELMKNKRRKRTKSDYSNDSKNISPGKYIDFDTSSKIDASFINSDYDKSSKKKVIKLMSTKYKYINKNFFQNMYNNKLIMQKRIRDDKKKLNYSQMNIRINKSKKIILKNKLNIINKNNNNEKIKEFLIEKDEINDNNKKEKK